MCERHVTRFGPIACRYFALRYNTTRSRLGQPGCSGRRFCHQRTVECRSHSRSSRRTRPVRQPSDSVRRRRCKRTDSDL